MSLALLTRGLSSSGLSLLTSGLAVGRREGVIYGAPTAKFELVKPFTTSLEPIAPYSATIQAIAPFDGDLELVEAIAGKFEVVHPFSGKMEQI